MTDKQRRDAFDFAAKRDGKRCRYCPPDVKRKNLVLHHIDNDPDNNPKDGSNWAIACKPHNHILNPRGLSRFNPKRNLRIEDLRRTRPQTEEMRRNIKAKTLFLEYFHVCIDQFGKVDIDDICGFVSREGGVVCSTVERYCDDIVRGKSPYYIDDDNCIKEHPKRSEPDDDELLVE